MTVNLIPPGKSALQIFCFPDSVTNLDDNTYEVEMALTLTGYTFYSGTSVSLEFKIDDINDNESPEFKQTISF